MKRRPAATRQPPDRPRLTPAADRRAFLALCSGWGLTTTLFPGVLWAEIRKATAKVVTRDLIDAAAAVAGIEVADEHKDAMLAALNEQVESIEEVRALNLGNDRPPALLFDPVLERPRTVPRRADAVRLSATGPVRAPGDIEELAFAPITHLARLLHGRKISSTALTEMYLARLTRFDPVLHAVITLTRDRALAQAREADRELAAGKYRGPLHGIPWGAKDLLSVKGYPTTWGAGWLREQRFESDATVVQWLDAAGAVLVAKLSLGTLAMNADQWFGGMTRNPWNTAQGAKGSSAGPASAVAAGCVGFAIGSETLDSISAPCARCGATGLRPTFGRVPRTGAMALCWSLDKLGPICRTVEDCALVLAAINGGDAADRSTREVPFSWDARGNVRALRVGYLKGEFEGDGRGIGPNQESAAERLERQRIDAEALDGLRRLGVSLAPIDLPPVPWRALLTIPKAEAAATFDELIRHESGLPDAERDSTWAQIFRVARFLPAVDYITANRARLAGMQGMARLFEGFDVIVAPTSSVQLIVTNLTGHPALVLPNGFRADGTPASMTFLGDLFGEAKMLVLAHAYQQSTDWHTRRPPVPSERSVAAADSDATGAHGHFDARTRAD